MERNGLVSNDPRLKTELAKWLEEIPGEFELVEVSPPAPTNSPESAPESPSEESPEEPLKYRFVIFDAQSGYQLKKIRDEVELQDVPWLAIGLEEHARDPHDPDINGADDLILLPLDRSVFLQKVEYLIAGKTKITPSFLYLAKSDLPIELAKSVHITHLSEVGCTILAPRPLARGVEGTLISRIFGDGAFRRVEVRTIDSNPCFDSSIANAGEPAREPTFEVRLRFFGLKHKQVTELRKWILLHKPEGLPEIIRSETPPKNAMHIALISPQFALSQMLRSSLENLAHIEISEFAGFRRFRRELLQTRDREAAAGKPEEPRGPASARIQSRDFIGPKTQAQNIRIVPGGQINVLARLASESTPGVAEKIVPPMRGHEMLFGATSEAWMKDLAVLSKHLNEHDREAFDEAVQWVVANSNLTSHPEVTIQVDVDIPEVQKTHVALRISLSEASTPARPPLIKIHMEEVEETKSPLIHSAASRIPCEAILIDASLLDFDLQAKVNQLSEWLEMFDVRNSFGNRPPIVVINASETRLDPELFRGTSVRQLAYDFADRRYHAELFISLSRPELWTSPHLAVSELNLSLQAFLARPSKASAVSEVSLVISDRSALRPGTELLVLSPLWSQAPEGLWAKLRAASPQEGGFENEFIFFGVSDLVQKEIRKFARADYIKKKAQGQGS